MKPYQCVLSVRHYNPSTAGTDANSGYESNIHTGITQSVDTPPPAGWHRTYAPGYSAHGEPWRWDQSCVYAESRGPRSECMSRHPLGTASWETATVLQSAGQPRQGDPREYSQVARLGGTLGLAGWTAATHAVRKRCQATQCRIRQMPVEEVLDVQCGGKWKGRAHRVLPQYLSLCSHPGCSWCSALGRWAACSFWSSAYTCIIHIMSSYYVGSTWIYVSTWILPTQTATWNSLLSISAESTISTVPTGAHYGMTAKQSRVSSAFWSKIQHNSMWKDDVPVLTRARQPCNHSFRSKIRYRMANEKKSEQWTAFECLEAIRYSLTRATLY